MGCNSYEVSPRTTVVPGPSRAPRTTVVRPAIPARCGSSHDRKLERRENEREPGVKESVMFVQNKQYLFTHHLAHFPASMFFQELNSHI